MIQEQNIAPAPFRFKNFIIKESHIKFESDTKAETIDLKIEPKGIIFEEKKLFEVTLNIDLKSKDGLDVTVIMIGIFEFKDVVKPETLTNYFYINAPAIIFPYLRSYISALTALSGVRTIIIPPMNIASVGKNLQTNTVISKG